MAMVMARRLIGMIPEQQCSRPPSHKCQGWVGKAAQKGVVHVYLHGQSSRQEVVGPYGLEDLLVHDVAAPRCRGLGRPLLAVSLSPEWAPQVEARPTVFFLSDQVCEATEVIRLTILGVLRKETQSSISAYIHPDQPSALWDRSAAGSLPGRLVGVRRWEWLIDPFQWVQQASIPVPLTHVLDVNVSRNAEKDIAYEHAVAAYPKAWAAYGQRHRAWKTGAHAVWIGAGRQSPEPESPRYPMRPVRPAPEVRVARLEFRRSGGRYYWLFGGTVYSAGQPLSNAEVMAAALSNQVEVKDVRIGDPAHEPIELVAQILQSGRRLSDEERLKVDALNAALSDIGTRQRCVIQLRYGLLDGRRRTQREVGRLAGQTAQRISQIESTALARLRHPAYRRLLAVIILEVPDRRWTPDPASTRRYIQRFDRGIRPMEFGQSRWGRICGDLVGQRGDR